MCNFMYYLPFLSEQSVMYEQEPLWLLVRSHGPARNTKMGDNYTPELCLKAYSDHMVEATAYVILFSLEKFYVGSYMCYRGMYNGN